jgi:hypothetical protein
MKNISKFKTFESNQWWAGKLSEYDIEKEELVSYFNYLDDEYDVTIQVNLFFCNDNYEILSKKTDLLDEDYYLSYHIRIDNNNINEISSPNEFIKYHQYLMNGINSISKFYKTKIVQHSNSSTIINTIDKSQPLTKNDVVFKKYPKSLMELIKEKIEKINKICYIVEEEEDRIFVKENTGTTPEKLEEILLRMFDGMISDNVLKVDKTSKKIRLVKSDTNPKGKYETVDRYSLAWPHITYKSIFQISII